MSNHITPEQKQYLENLICERISSNERNLRIVEGFRNTQNPHLVDTIQNEANTQDENGEIAYYVVKHKEHADTILCYFSLKSGILFNQMGELELLEAKKKFNSLIKHKQSLHSESSHEFEILQKDIDKEIARLKSFLTKNFSLYKEDEKHKRVAKTYSAIEIMHFCVNENARKIWNNHLMGEKNRIGLTIFWSHIVPIILKISKYMGLKYLYLFAADETVDQKLINHYITFMNFEHKKDLYTALPIYDFGCTLLIQEIENLKSKQDEFFEYFNLADQI